MQTERKGFRPYLVALSLLANVFWAVHSYRLDHELNLVTWGNSVDTVWQHVNWINIDIRPTPDRSMPLPAPSGSGRAVDDLEALRSLPYYSRRVVEEDMRTLEHFLRYADQAYTLAVKEQNETGAVSPESAQRLAKVKEGIQFILSHQARTNQLKLSWNPWNHTAWRAVWQSIATGLRDMDFVPLPE